MTAAARLEQPRDLTSAEDLAQRTARAVAYVMEKHAATDMASFIDSLQMPDDERARGLKIEDATEVFLRALSHVAAYTFGLCVFSLKSLDDAGKMFRRVDVQTELRARAMRVSRSVMGE